MLRAGYTTSARLLDGSDTEVTIRWYEVPDTAPTLNLPSKVLSLNWHARPWQVRGIGEVFGADRPFSRWRPPGGAPADHVCGDPQWYLTGVPVDPARPVVEYGPDGLPLCCRPGVGAAQIGGRAVVPTRSPGVLLGGSALVGGVGSLLVGGSAAAVRATGAAVLGGAAGVASMNGSVLLGGGASVGEPPLPECESAGLMVISLPLMGTTLGGPLYQWWELSGWSPGDSVRVDLTASDPAVQVVMYRGSGCADAEPVGSVSGVSGCVSTGTGTGDRVWVSVSYPGPDPISYTLVPSVGTCP